MPEPDPQPADAADPGSATPTAETHADDSTWDRSTKLNLAAFLLVCAAMVIVVLIGAVGRALK